MELARRKRADQPSRVKSTAPAVFTECLRSVAVISQCPIYEPKTHDHQHTEPHINENIDHEGSLRPVVMFPHEVDFMGLSGGRKQAEYAA